jgi:hypothetical protein
VSELLILEFDGVDPSLYDVVNGTLGVNPHTGEGNWPDGLISHTAGAGADGSFFVLEEWESQAKQGDFMASRLGPALGQAGVGEPKRVEWLKRMGNRHFG